MMQNLTKKILKKLKMKNNSKKYKKYTINGYVYVEKKIIILKIIYGI